jgi:hypothetical protein
MACSLISYDGQTTLHLGLASVGLTNSNLDHGFTRCITSILDLHGLSCRRVLDPRDSIQFIRPNV